MLGNIHLLDKQKGFRDAQFGQRADKVGDWVLTSVHHDPRVLTYARESDVLLHSGYPLRQIHYRFFDEQLYRVDLLVTGSDIISGLRQEFIRLYGLPTVGPLGDEWLGQQVTASILLFRTRTDNAYFTLSSQVLMAMVANYVYHRNRALED